MSTSLSDARLGGVEPPAFGTGNQRSIQLSYKRLWRARNDLFAGLFRLFCVCEFSRFWVFDLWLMTGAFLKAIKAGKLRGLSLVQ